MNFKNLILVISLIYFVDCSFDQKQPYLYFGEDKLEVHFERPMSDSLLDAIDLELRKYNYSIVYPDKSRDGNLLNNLSFVIYKNENVIGVAATHFVNMRAKDFGFIILLNKETEFIKVGEL